MIGFLNDFECGFGEGFGGQKIGPSWRQKPKSWNAKRTQKIYVNKDMGLDSLMSVELRNQLKKMFDDSIQITPTLMFDYPNIDLTSDYLLSLIFKIEKKSDLVTDNNKVPKISEAEAEKELLLFLEQEMNR